ncbi:MAG TPA: cardiolipin synthase [Candidatus Binatia bacterium]
MQTSQGRLSASSSEKILAGLARQSGVSDVLLHHVAVEEAYAGSPLVVGNRVDLLRDGDQAYPAMEKELGLARRSIDLEVYTFRDDEVGKRFAQLLQERARHGVDVRVMYDSVGCLSTDREFFDSLRSAGVAVIEFNPVNPLTARGRWRLEHRDHRKLLVVDGRVAFTGGINISTEYAGSGRSSSSGGGRVPVEGKAWRDTQVRIEGPVVSDFARLFDDSWRKQEGPPPRRSHPSSPPPPAGSDIVRAIGSTPDDAESIIHKTLLSAISHAERSVHLTQMYFVPDPDLVRLVEADARRGLDVRIILPSEGFWMTRYAGRSHFSELLRAGVHVYERRGPLLHAKTAVIDGVWSTVGSANLDYRSFAKNDEVNAVVLGEDFGDQLEAMFRDDIAESQEITAARWKRRGPSTRFKEIVARLWERML